METDLLGEQTDGRTVQNWRGICHCMTTASPCKRPVAAAPWCSSGSGGGGHRSVSQPPLETHCDAAAADEVEEGCFAPWGVDALKPCRDINSTT